MAVNLTAGSHQGPNVCLQSIVQLDCHANTNSSTIWYTLLPDTAALNAHTNYLIGLHDADARDALVKSGKVGHGL